MVLEDSVQRSSEKLLQRIRDHAEPEVRGFVSELLTAAARERATALDDERRHADEDRQRAVQQETARVRVEIDEAWAVKLQAATHTERERWEHELRSMRKEAARRLFEEVARARTTGERALAAALATARDAADRTLAQRVDEVRAEAERTRVAEVAALEARVAVRPDADAILARLAQGLRRLDDASSLTDLLDTLVAVAADEAPRAGVLLVRDQRVEGWRLVGFGDTLGAASEVDLAWDEAGIVGQTVVAAESRAVTAGGDGVSDDAAPGFVSLAQGVTAQVAPVLVGGSVVAVLYADNAGEEPSPGWSASLEILARHAGHRLEAVTAARTAQLARLVATGGVKADEPKPPFDEDSRLIGG